ncbi:MAG: response regulator [Lachnospiraceae bacterium]|nr:response regulator [Lachnospiraceae bacterium]
MEGPKILLIAENRSFMVNAIIKDLEKEGYEAAFSGMAVNELGKLEKLPGICLIYIDNVEGNEGCFTYLRDRITEEGASLMAVLKSEDEDSFFSMIPREKLSAVFPRPFNVKVLGEKLAEISEKREKAAQKKRILVVDDDGTMLRTIKTWLQNKYQVFMVNSGMEAIRFLVNNEVDLILLDYEMPVITGPKVLEMLRSDPATQSIPVMFLTVKSDKESVMQVVALKPEKYLLKTMPPEELIANVDEFFERKKVTL